MSMHVIAGPHELREVVYILRGGGVASDSETLPEEKEAAHDAEIAFERQRVVEDSMDQGFHQPR